MRAVLNLNPSALTFTHANGGGAYPLLNDVGPLRMAARTGQKTGIGVNESTSISITLDNRSRRASALIGRPLRTRATIYDDDGNIFFAGTISSVTYGRFITLEVDA